MKLCKDCKHYRETSFYSNRCTRDVKKKIDLINGKEYETSNEYSCYCERECPIVFDVILFFCGKRARYFEQKER